MSADVWGDERRGWERLRPGSTPLVFSGSVLTLYTCRMLGLVGWDVGFLWFSIDVLSWKHMETAGRFASKPGCHSTFVRCMPSTRQGRKAFVVHGGCPGFCVSDLSYLEGRQSCACWPTFDEYNASKRPTFYVCLLLFSSQICLKPFASSSSASLLLEGASPLPKFVFTSSLAVFGETYVEAGIPVGSGGMSLCA